MPLSSQGRGWGGVIPRRKQMEIGVGLDMGLGVSFDEHRELARDAARLGYQSIWSNAGNARDALHVCAQWWGASAEVAGVSVSGRVPRKRSHCCVTQPWGLNCEAGCPVLTIRGKARG